MPLRCFGGGNHINVLGSHIQYFIMIAFFRVSKATRYNLATGSLAPTFTTNSAISLVIYGPEAELNGGVVYLVLRDYLGPHFQALHGHLGMHFSY
jgi:hypothetical protein